MIGRVIMSVLAILIMNIYSSYFKRKRDEEIKQDT